MSICVFDWGPGAAERPALTQIPQNLVYLLALAAFTRAAHSDEVVGAWTGRVVSAKGRCPQGHILSRHGRFFRMPRSGLPSPRES